MNTLPVVTLSGLRPRAEPSGPEALRDLLEVWSTELESIGYPLADSVAEGRDPDEVRDYFKKMGLDVNEELVVWFSWHDGQSPYTAPWLTPSHQFMNLEWAVTQRAYGARLGTEFGDWNPTWIRLSDDQVSVAADTATERVRIVDNAEWNTWEPTSDTEVDSLCTAVVWFIEAIRTGAHIWNRRAGRWDRANDLVDPVARLHGYV
ncbi:hypothetical protein [Mesorhizobium japonicum]|uniref:hypothetical protein n=1 Tax=Mesorhizobium japonicum TaxID=2066070 RepID=UPI003B5CE30E